MFGFSSAPDLALRSRKDLARAAQLRSLARSSTRHNPTSSPASYDDMFLPSLSRNTWRRNMLGNRSGAFQTPNASEIDIPALFPPNMYEARRFEELEEQLSPSPHRPARASAPSGYHAAASFPLRGDSTSSSRNQSPLPFEKAARALHETLLQALRYNEMHASHFAEDIHHISVYADPRVISHLWAAKMAYPGVPVSVRRENPDASPDPKTDYYAKTAARLLEAVADMLASGPPSVGGLGDGGEEAVLTPEDVMTTLRKLRVSLLAIVELSEAVRTERQRHAALIKELRSALALLGEVQEVWSVGVGANAGTSARGKDGREARQRREAAGLEREFEEWPSYRGE